MERVELNSNRRKIFVFGFDESEASTETLKNLREILNRLVEANRQLTYELNDPGDSLREAYEIVREIFDELNLSEEEYYSKYPNEKP